MSNNKPTSCVDSDGRRYKKSKYCDCCNSPTTSQESEDAGGVDDCDLNEEKWSEWMGHHPNSGEVVRDCDVSVNSQSISHSTYTAEEEESSVLNGAVLHTPEVNKIVPHVASSNPSLSTTSTTPSSLERPYRYSSYKKNNYRNFDVSKRPSWIQSCLNEIRRKKLSMRGWREPKNWNRVP